MTRHPAKARLLIAEANERRLDLTTNRGRAAPTADPTATEVEVPMQSNPNSLGERPLHPESEDHRVLRVQHGLTTVGCNCRWCENERDLAIIHLAEFGEEDERALAAIDRTIKRWAR